MKNESRVQAIERIKKCALFLPDGYIFDREKANTRRAAIATARVAVKDKRTEGPSAARSQDFHYGEDV